MGIINDNQEFASVRLNLQDIFKAKGGAVMYAFASLGMWYLRRHTPDLAQQVRDTNTLTQWAFDKGELVVCIGKQGYPDDETKKAINKYLEHLQ